VGLSAYRPRLDTRIDLFAGPIQGSVDFESTLGLEDTKSVPVADLRWRISKRNTFRIDYFKLDRSGFSNSPVDIQICEGDPPTCNDVNGLLGLNSFVDVEVLNFGYDFSIFFTEKLNWSVGLGLSAQDFAFGIKTDDPEFPTNPEAKAKFTAPLPTLATTFNYAFTDKWILDVALNWLEIDLDLDSSGKFDGRILGFDAGMRWQTWKNIGFVFKYSSFDLDMEIDDGDELGGSIKYKYRGPKLGINAYF